MRKMATRPAATSFAHIATRRDSSAADEKALRRRGSTAGAVKRKARGKARVMLMRKASAHENVFGTFGIRGLKSAKAAGSFLRPALWGQRRDATAGASRLLPLVGAG